MIVNQNVIYANESQTGASLRRELKRNKLPKVFYTTERTPQPVFNRKLAISEDDLRLTRLAEEKGYQVVDVVHTKKGVLIRTKF